MGRLFGPFLLMCLLLCSPADAMVSPVGSSFGNSACKHPLILKTASERPPRLAAIRRKNAAVNGRNGFSAWLHG